MLFCRVCRRAALSGLSFFEYEEWKVPEIYRRSWILPECREKISKTNMMIDM